MLCERPTDPARLADRRYIAEPKLDCQRAQLHVPGGRALAC
jgi:ATP-dependent DNA ligase